MRGRPSAAGTSTVLTVARPRRARPARTLAVLALAISATTAGAACGSSSSKSTATKLAPSCTAVSDVLADGPDPDADPVGYAEAQIRPLRQLRISDPALQKAVTALAAAYQAFSSADGSNPAATSVDAAQKAVNGLCPGAAQ